MPRAAVGGSLRSPRREGELGHHALGILSAKLDGEGYDWRTFVHRGGGGHFDAELDEEGRFIWRETPAGLCAASRIP